MINNSPAIQNLDKKNHWFLLGFFFILLLLTWIFDLSSNPNRDSQFWVFEILKSSLILGAAIFSLFHLRALEKQSQAQQNRILNSSKFAALGEVASGMAHEINTPLGAITLSASQLKDLVPAESEHREMISEIIEDILASSDKISRIVRGLKNYSRDSSKGADVVFCDLLTVLNESLALCEASLRSKNIEVKWGEVPKKLDLQCNPAQLSQVIINLVNNARDALVNENEKWINVSVKSSAEMVELRITDSGKGIPVAIREKLFQPFFTTKEVGSGTGLGLSIIHGIVTNHGGQVYVDEQGEHTSFVVKLPRFQLR